MKKLLSIKPYILLISVLTIISCQSNSSENLEQAKIEKAEAKENLNEARKEYILDMEKYRKETHVKISENEQSIKDFKARVANSKKEAKADYDKTISDLEKQNTDMKRKLDEYKLEGKDEWNSFKTEFNHDMDELGRALKDLTVSNTN